MDRRRDTPSKGNETTSKQKDEKSDQGEPATCPQHSEKIRAAWKKNYEATIKMKDENIHQLRKENLSLAKELSERKIAEDQNKVHPSSHRNVTGAVFRMPGKKAESTPSNDVTVKMKHLNKLKCTTQHYQQHLDILRKESHRLKPDSDPSLARPNTPSWHDEETDRCIRTLEIEIEKTRFMYSQAAFNMRDHQKLTSLIQGVSLTCKSQSDHLHIEIQKYKMSLDQQQANNTKTQVANKALEANLQQLKEQYDDEENERELNLIACRKNLLEAKNIVMPLESDSIDQKTHTLNMTSEEVSNKIAEVTEVIYTFEEALKNIRLAVGVSDNQKIVETWVKKLENQSQLEKRKTEKDKVLQQLRKKREFLCSKLRETDLSYGVKCYREQLELAQQSKGSAVAVELRTHLALFTTIKERVEYLADKLHHITLSEDTETSVSADPYELVLEQLSKCVQKLQLLKYQLRGENLSALRRKMKEINDTIEKGLPSYNNRIHLPDPGLESNDGE